MLILIFLCLFPLLLKADPQKCEELSIVISEADVQADFYLILQTTKNGDDKNWLTIKNYTHVSQIPSDGTPTTSIYERTPPYKFSINDIDLYNLTFPHTISVEDGRLDLSVHWNYQIDNSFYADKLIWGFFISDANFIFYNGQMFDEKNVCLDYNNIDSEFLFTKSWYAKNTSIQTCCTSFKTIIPAPSNFPKCNQFSISSTIYNSTTNNFQAATNAKFDLINSNFITAKGHHVFIGYTNFPLAINNLHCQMSFNDTQYCNYFLDDEDKTLFFQASSVDKDSNTFTVAGQVTLRNNQTLIADGIPFSSSNLCRNLTRFGHVDSDSDGPINITVISELCCTSFEGDIITPTPSVAPASPIKKDMQICKKVKINYNNDFFNSTISAILQASSLNSTNNIIAFYDLVISTQLNYDFIRIWGDEIAGENDTTANFTYGNTPFDIGIELYPTAYFNIFNGLVDNGSIVGFNGNLFEFDQNCITQTTQYGETLEACCTSYAEQAVPDTYKAHPKCENFQISSTFFNSTDNSVNAKLTTNFSLTETDLTGIGNIWISENVSMSSPPSFIINAFQSETGLSGLQFGGHPINGKDAEFLIHVRYETKDYGGGNFLAGKILIIDGQTLMEQGMPYTVSNNCAKFSSSRKNIGINAENEICCTKFASNPDSPFSSTTSSFTAATTSSNECVDSGDGCAQNLDKCRNSLYKPFMCKHCKKTCNLCHDPQCST